MLVHGPYYLSPSASAPAAGAAAPPPPPPAAAAGGKNAAAQTTVTAKASAVAAAAADSSAAAAAAATPASAAPNHRHHQLGISIMTAAGEPSESPLLTRGHIKLSVCPEAEAPVPAVGLLEARCLPPTRQRSECLASLTPADTVAKAGLVTPRRAVCRAAAGLAVTSLPGPQGNNTRGVKRLQSQRP